MTYPHHIRLGSRAGLLALSLVFGLAAGGCATIGPAAETAPDEKSQDPARRPGMPVVLIAMPSSANFQDVRRGLVAEITRDFDVSTFTVAKDVALLPRFTAAMNDAKPICVVLMNNTSLGLYREYQKSLPPGQVAPPAVAVMTSFLEELRGGVANTTGIAYEVPAVTGLVHLRSAIKAPVKRVGVVYRPQFRRFIARQTTLAAREHFEIVPIEVGQEVEAPAMFASLQTLIGQQHVDALWMLNDNGLIKSGEFLEQTWRSVLRDANVPLLVGVPNLVDPATTLGSLAVVPDHEALGLQAANLIFDLSENGWHASEHAVELPLSVKTIADMKQIRERFGLKPDALGQIDKPLE